MTQDELLGDSPGPRRRKWVAGGAAFAFGAGLLTPVVALSSGTTVPCNASKTVTSGKPPCPPTTETTTVTQTVTTPPVTNTVTTPTTVPAPKPPSPVTGKTVLAAKLGGVLYYRLRPGGPRVKLTGTQLLPIAAHLDTRTGALRLTTTAAHGLQSADVSAGVFKAEQHAAPVSGARDAAHATAVGPVTVLRLVGARIASCIDEPEAHQEPGEVLAVIARRRPRRHRVRSLWASDSGGSYQTVGTQAAATVRGTVWLTQDTCRGTRVYVRKGVVIVHDKRTGRTVRLTARHAYTALAPPVD
jgi:hypothetical protein